MFTELGSHGVHPTRRGRAQTPHFKPDRKNSHTSFLITHIQSAWHTSEMSDSGCVVTQWANLEISNIFYFTV